MRAAAMRRGILRRAEAAAAAAAEAAHDGYFEGPEDAPMDDPQFDHQEPPLMAAHDDPRVAGTPQEPAAP